MSTTVLVAEDEFLIAMDVMEELEAAGFRPVGPFARTSQALDYCQSHTPDCAVLDVRLADGESFPIADLLSRRNVPVIFHSGHAAPTMLIRRYPGTHICPKPTPASQLARLVAEICRRTRTLAGGVSSYSAA